MPCEAFLLKAIRDGSWPAVDGIDENSGKYEPVRILSVAASGKYLTVNIEYSDLKNRNFEQVQGQWICIQEQSPAVTPEYVYELIGRNVYQNGNKAGIVTDYFETGANGVIVLKLKNNEEILVPLLDDIVSYPDASSIQIQNLDQFIDMQN